MIALVTGGPDVKFCHSNSNLIFAYLPSVGRYFSNRCSWRMIVPVVAVLVVVSWVPMPIVTVVCAPAVVGTARVAAAVMTAEKLRYPELRAIAQPLFLFYI